ncbi:UDP-glycosyltransferase 87A2 [Amborella trichopoda]|uniref:UDP-glycosyltransferase 87A2 n=1 Tax=Amborella trichopoda TaxID=13333 RepID=UPI0009C01520|nr:UDP-glycosyltransferase 87A2 [Amborella trichopoda]|eukprot:XP_020519844.1 UDP-glycosyltransferase 87A2 [Amborella trichopoda]
MMGLCLRLASQGALIIIVVTEEWLGFMTSAQEPLPNVQLRSIPNVIPSELSRAADWSGFVEAVYSMMDEPVDRLIDSIEPMVSVILADVFMPWVADVAKRRGIPVTWLFPMATTVFSVFYHFDILLSKGHFPANSSANKEEYVDYIPGVSPTRILELPNVFKGGEPPRNS